MDRTATPFGFIGSSVTQNKVSLHPPDIPFFVFPCVVDITHIHTITVTCSTPRQVSMSLFYSWDSSDLDVLDKVDTEEFSSSFDTPSLDVSLILDLSAVS